MHLPPAAAHLNILLMIFANIIGIELYALYGNIDVGTIVGGITAIAAATLAMVKLVTPALADAIKVIGPALAELQKQREEIRKGSLQGQIEILQESQKAMAERVEDANQKLHDARNQAQFDSLKYIEEVQRTKETLGVLTEELRGARKEIDKLRMENMRLLRKTAQQIADNTAGIEEVRQLSDSALARLASLPGLNEEEAAGSDAN